MPPILSLQQLCKQYPGVIALDHVDLTVEKGEVRALLGKNGAGKSTLVKILSGAVHPDSGEIRIDGQPVTIAGPADAFAQGICTVYQEIEPGARADGGREHPAGPLAEAAPVGDVGHQP